MLAKSFEKMPYEHSLCYRDRWIALLWALPLFLVFAARSRHRSRHVIGQHDIKRLDMPKACFALKRATLENPATR